VALAHMNFAEDLMDPSKTHWTKKGEIDEKQMTILDVVGCLFAGFVGFILFVLAVGPAIIAWLEDRF
jgi:hypothetical protein